MSVYQSRRAYRADMYVMVSVLSSCAHLAFNQRTFIRLFNSHLEYTGAKALKSGHMNYLRLSCSNDLHSSPLRVNSHINLRIWDRFPLAIELSSFNHHSSFHNLPFPWLRVIIESYKITQLLKSILTLCQLGVSWSF